MFVITQSCCSDAACVSVCPVDCIHPTPQERGFGSSDILHIDPQSCIDCGACSDACPVDAIFPADKLGERDKVFIGINADFYKNKDDAAAHQEPAPLYPHLPKLPGDLRIALVGTGPAGGYALRTLLDRTQARVTVIDRLPTPGGLVRAGVAPDHPGTKKVLRGFDLLYRDPRVSMATNVEVGPDTGAGQITPAELADHFDAVFYAVGASESRRLGIPGEDVPGSTSATDLVAWYNAVPGAHSGVPARHPSPGSETGRVVVVGTGNVALDVARILVSPPASLAATDIADRALKILHEQNVHEVILLGRRDQAHAAYTSAEFRALEAVPGVSVVVHDDPDVAIDDAWSRPADPAQRRIVLLFHTAPERIVGDDFVRGMTVRTGDRQHTITADLAVRSIGYRSVPIGGLPFDDERGTFPNTDGRMLDAEGQVMPGIYVTGWAKRGPSGGIGTNRLCAQSTVETFLSDAADGRLPRTNRRAGEFEKLLRSRTRSVIGYRGVRAIDRHERRLGMLEGRPRKKFTELSQMMAVAGRRRR